MIVAGFDWDDGNWPKCGRHGVSRREIEQAVGSSRFVVDDPNLGEERYRTVGLTEHGRHVFVVYTWRLTAEGSILRPISARFMHRKEIQNYEKGVARFTKR